MAKSSGTKGFDYRGSLLGVNASPVTVDVLIDDSATLTLGDAVIIDTDGNLDVASATSPVLGVLLGIVDNAGINVFESGRAAGTDGSTLTGDDTIAVSSTNTSDATRNIKGRVGLTFSANSKWYNDTTASLAQTNLFQFFDLTATGDQVETGSGSSDASGIVQLIEIDPDGDADLSKGIFVFAETQILGNIDQATARLAA